MITLEQAEEMLKEADKLHNNLSFNESLYLLEQISPILEKEAEPETYVRFLNLYSECLKSTTNYEESKIKAEQALSMSLEKLGKDHLQTAYSYYTLGKCYGLENRLNDAIINGEKAISIYNNVQNGNIDDLAKFYNLLGLSHQYLGNIEDAINCFNKVLELILPKYGEEHIRVIDSYIGLGECYKFLNNFDKSFNYLKSALAISLKDDVVLNYRTCDCYGHLGSLFHEYGDCSSAIKHLKKALILAQDNYGKAHNITTDLIFELGNAYLEIGDFSSAFNYYIKGFSINSKILYKEDFSNASYYLLLGQYYFITQNYAVAYKFFDKCLTLFLKLSENDHPFISTIYRHLGSCALELGNLEQAFTYLQKALTIGLVNYSKTRFSIAINYLHLGVYYCKSRNYPQALDSYLEALNIYIAVFGEIHANTTEIYNAIASYYQELNDIPNVLHYAQKALQSLGLPVAYNEYYLLPELNNYNSALKLYDTLIIKAKSFLTLFNQNGHFKDIAASIAHLYVADRLIDLMRVTYKAEGSKLFLAEKSKKRIYDEAFYVSWIFAQYLLKTGQQTYSTEIADVNHSLGYALPYDPTETAFYFSEKSKSVVLYASMKDAEARLTVGLPTDLLEQEFNLRLDITFLEKKLMEEKQKAEEKQDKTKIVEWEFRHLDCKQQYESLIELFETDYPAYYHLKHDLKVADIPQIQANLSPQTAMISYVLSDKYLYTIVITANNSHWLQQDIPAGFEAMIEDFMFSFEPFSKEEYITYAHDMYRILLQPLEQNGWLDGIERLVIIPDGILSRIPFEALLTQTTSAATPYQSLDYLLNRYIISYHYSATLWLNQQTKQERSDENKANFIGFAPIYSNTITESQEHDIDLSIDEEMYKQLGLENPKELHRIQYDETEGILRGKVEGKEYIELQYSETEVQMSGKAFAENGHSARILLHQSATLDNFKALAGQYRYLLIAAHADVDDQHPEHTGIIFSPNEQDGKGIFYMSDAYNLTLQAEVVVLSCCETGLGKITKGEGTMALNRGFLYAGAKNVVYTLFKVYDKESSQLTTHLFSHLLAKQSCAEALHNAKLLLIQQGLMPIKWAGYVLVGE